MIQTISNEKRISMIGSHQCEKSEGKIMRFETDNLGGMFCGYCHQRIIFKEAKNETQSNVTVEVFKD